MATYATDLQTFTLADSATGFAELAGHLSGSAPAATTENYYHNGTAVDQATGQATGTNAGMQYDNGSAVSWTSGWVFMAWQKFDAGTNIFSWSAGGMRLGIGSSSGNMNFWNALGDDFGNYPSGGWQNTAVDPEVTADATDGSPSAGTYQLFGSLPNMRAKITKGSPHVVDAVRYGRGEFQVTDTGCTFSGMATANDADTARWGLFSLQGGSYLWKGLMSLGLSGTSCTFSDSNKSIRVDDTPRVSAGFNKINVNNASTSITWNSISINGVQTSITGSAPVSKGEFVSVDDATIDWDGCTFTDFGTFTFYSDTTKQTIDDCTFRRCETITASGTAEGQGAAFVGCLFTNSPSASTLVTHDLSRADDCTFISDGSNHAVELTSIGDGTMTWNNATTGYAAGSTGSPVTPTSTGNEAIYVNANTASDLTINVAAGASIPSIRVGASFTGNVNVVAGQVTLTITVKDIDTGSPIQNAMVYVLADTGGGLSQGTPIINKVLTDVNGQATDTRSYSGDQPITGRVRKSTSGTLYKTAPVAGTVSSANGLSLTIQMIKDQ